MERIYKLTLDTQEGKVFIHDDLPTLFATLEPWLEEMDIGFWVRVEVDYRWDDDDGE